MKFTIKSSNFDAASRKIEEAGKKAAHALALQVAKDTEPFVPALTKSLANRAKVEGNVILYPGPYARYLYEGKVMVDPKTGAAGFLTKNGWKSRKGVTKVLTDRSLVFNKSVHGQAQDHWFEAAKVMNKEKWIRAAGKAMKDEMK